MRTPRAAILLPALAGVALAAASTVPCSSSQSLECAPALTEQYLQPRDGSHGHGGHGHHAQPLTELNETEVTMYHDPTPDSYYWIDFVASPNDEPRYPGLMGMHALFMSLAFFGALPIGAHSLRLSSKPIPR